MKYKIGIGIVSKDIYIGTVEECMYEQDKYNKRWKNITRNTRPMKDNCRDSVRDITLQDVILHMNNFYDVIFIKTILKELANG